MYEHLIIHHRFSLLCQREIIITSVLSIRSSSEGVDEASAGHDKQHGYVMRHLVYIFLRKINEIVWNNTLYREEDTYVQSYHLFLVLRRAYDDDQLPFYFMEMKDAGMKLLNIQKPFTPQLEIINLEDDGTTLVDHVIALQ